MNKTLFRQAIEAALRHGFTKGLGLAIALGLSAEQYNAITAAIAGTLAAYLLDLAYALWFRYVITSKFWTALALPQGSTSRDVDLVIASGQTPEIPAKPYMSPVLTAPEAP